VKAETAIGDHVDPWRRRRLRRVDGVLAPLRREAADSIEELQLARGVGIGARQSLRRHGHAPRQTQRRDRRRMQAFHLVGEAAAAGREHHARDGEQRAPRFGVDEIVTQHEHLAPRVVPAMRGRPCATRTMDSSATCRSCT
jgi:hypothetical protein